MLGIDERRRAAVTLRRGDDASVSVVLPEDSGPKISMTRPRGMPPTPSAISSPSEPVGIDSTS
jgi:hypothetical protein